MQRLQYSTNSARVCRVRRLLPSNVVAALAEGNRSDYDDFLEEVNSAADFAWEQYLSPPQNLTNSPETSSG